MEYKLICLDIDGTLLNSKHEITELTKKAIQEVTKKGIPVVLISARMPKAMTYIRDELGIKDPMVSYGGAIITENDQVIMNKMMEHEALVKIYHLAQEMKVHMSIYQENNWYVETLDDWAAQEGEITHLVPSIQSFPALINKWEEEHKGANKILLMAEPETLGSVMNEAAQLMDFQVDMYRSKDTYLEIMPKGVGKKEVLEVLCRRYQISRENVVAVGDNDNDMDMICYAGLGVAMGNAKETVKACADYVTKSNDEDGIYEVIRQFL